MAMTNLSIDSSLLFIRNFLRLIRQSIPTGGRLQSNFLFSASLLLLLLTCLAPVQTPEAELAAQEKKISEERREEQKWISVIEAEGKDRKSRRCCGDSRRMNRLPRSRRKTSSSQPAEDHTFGLAAFGCCNRRRIA
jgi:hypothetical protein